MINEDIVFVNTFFQALNKNNIRYCILRNADEVLHGNAHDIDMTVESYKIDDAFKLLLETAKNLNWRLHLKTGSENDNNNIKCLHFHKEIAEKVLLIHFDFFPTFTWNGLILLNNNDLLEKVDTSSLYHSSNPGIESVTKLFIRLLHNGYIKPKYKHYIFEAFFTYKEIVISTLQKFLPNERVDIVYEQVLKCNWNDLEGDREKIIADMKCILKKKSGYRKNKFLQKKYLVEKALKKAGLMIVFVGTDGSGKTTIIDSLPSVLERTFNEDLIDYYHWRPGFIRSPKNDSNNKHKQVCTDPHKEKPYGRFVSIAKFMYFNMDYIFGYWFKVRLQLSKGHLVIFDRYYYDYYLDKLRYRLNISERLLDLFKVIIPKPDITFLLMGDALILYERKKEIPVEEIQKQLERMIKQKDKFQSTVVIDVNQDIDTVVNEVSNYILKYCNRKYKKWMYGKI